MLYLKSLYVPVLVVALASSALVSAQTGPTGPGAVLSGSPPVALPGTGTAAAAQLNSASLAAYLRSMSGISVVEKPGIDGNGYGGPILVVTIARPDGWKYVTEIQFSKDGKSLCS